MGRAEDPLACVDSNFKVSGVQGLRIADLSVCPVIPRYVGYVHMKMSSANQRDYSNHTQTTAYLIGQKAADKLIAEYQLNAHKSAL